MAQSLLSRDTSGLNKFKLTDYPDARVRLVAGTLQRPGHCAQSRPVVHLATQDIAETRAERRKATLFSSFLPSLPFGEREGRGYALVLAPEICHVPHRTALLSQLMACRARGPPPCPPCKWGRKKVGEKAREGHPPGRGRVERRHKSSQRPASGTKVASRMSGSPLAQPPPFSPRKRGREGRGPRGTMWQNLDAGHSGRRRGARG